ncbi:MAG: dTMP kinase [Phycisphaerae bacterium]
MSILTRPHEHPGRLIVVEGIDGSGKTTQLALLRRWLETPEQPVFFTEWNSSELVKKATKLGKKKATLTPITFALLHATDFADRHLYQIVPPLKAGMYVLADRYAYTAFARDRARGVHAGWIRNTYAFATQPDIAFYFRVPIDVALDRLLANRAKLKYYEAGMDMNLSTDLAESFRLFQSRVIDEYDRMVEEFGLVVIDATRPIPDQQAQVREIVAQRLGLTRRGGSL